MTRQRILASAILALIIAVTYVVAASASTFTPSPNSYSGVGGGEVTNEKGKNIYVQCANGSIHSMPSYYSSPNTFYEVYDSLNYCKYTAYWKTNQIRCVTMHDTRDWWNNIHKGHTVPGHWYVAYHYKVYRTWPSDNCGSLGTFHNTGSYQ